MSIERIPNSHPTQEHDGGRDVAESRFSIEPTKGLSAFEAAKRSRERFVNILRSADIRSLVRYLQGARVNIDAQPEIPLVWKEHFKTEKFRAQSYTWMNPNLYLLTPEVAASLAFAELLARIKDGPLKT